MKSKKTPLVKARARIRELQFALTMAETVLRGETEAMHRRAQSAESRATVADRERRDAVAAQRRISRDLAAERKRADVRQAARLAALASSRAMMDFAARVAPMIMEDRPREELIELIDECAAMRFRLERGDISIWQREMQKDFTRQEDE